MKTKIFSIVLFLTLFTLVAQVPSYVPTNGLVAYYPFNGNANDVSSNGNNGINYGATPTTDRNGTANSAMNFNGVNNYISIPYSTSIGVQQEITVSFWVLFNGGGCSPRIIQSSPWGQCGGFTIATSSTSNTSRYFYTNFENCSFGVLSPTSPSLTGLTWHHVVWSASGLTGISKMYFDGVLVDTDITNGFFTSINYFNRPITIGNVDATSCDWFGGKLDDIGIWNRVLTTQEIANLYSQTNPVTCLPSNVPTNGLVGYWPFCGNANDESGNNNNGTVNGATLTTDRNGNANSAYSYDGVNDYIQVPHSSSISITGDITMSAWVKTNGSNGQNYQTIISKRQTYWTWEYLMTLSYHNSIIHDTKLLSSRGVAMGNQEQGWSTTPYSINNWENWVVTISNNQMKIYKNGMLDHTQAFSLVPVNQVCPLLFGKNTLSDNTNSEQFKGSIDDIGIWNRALTAQEIANLYNPCATPPAAPVATASQTFCATPAPTVASLTATGTGIQWYDAATGGNVVASTATLTNGQIVYASQTVAGCESTTRAAVTVTLNDPQITASATTVCSGTAVSISAASATANPLTCNLPTNLQNGLVGYWPFCGNANDASGNNNNGTVNGATLTTDRFGNANSAYNFDGLSNVISVQDSNSLNQNVFTISSWVNGVEFNGFKQILSKNIGTSNNESINLVINNNSNWNLTAQIGGLGYYGTLIQSPNTISENQWHHIVYNYNENTNSQKLFIDGLLVANNTTTDLIQFDNKPLTFGAQLEFNLLQYFFNGKIDDIGFWNRALSPTEITQLYNTNQTTYFWSTGETTATINPTPTTTTTYWCDVTVNGVTCRKEVIITVNSTTSPVATASQTFCATPAPTVASLTATGTGIQWYDAATGGNLVASTATLTNGQVLYASQTVAGCESTTRAAVTVTLNDPQITASATTVCSGTAVNLAAASATANPLTCSLPTNLQNGLVGYWPFCGNANDASGNGNNGTVNGATLTTDRFGNANNAYSFDGVSSRIFVNNPIFNNGENFTFSSWYFLNTNINPNNGNSSHIILNTSPHNGFGVALNWGSSNKYSISVGSGTPSTSWNTLFNSVSNQNIEIQSWKYITLVKSSNNYTLYINGVYDQTWVANNSVQSYLYKLYFGGCDPIVSNEVINGKLDDISIFNRALNTSEIAQLYSSAPTYLWSTGETTATINPTPTATTTYWCDVTVNGVTCRKEVTITVNSTTSPVATASQTFCATPAPTVASLTATGTGIQWYDAATGGNVVASTATLTNGQIVYASQTVAGCESSDRLSVTVALNDPQINASATTICIGNTVNLSASTTVNPLTCSLPTNLQNGLVGYWPFCGNANDASGNNNNGTVNGATLTTDRFGNANSAYSFDGMNDYLQCNSVNLNNTITTEFWYKNATDIQTNLSNGHPPIGAEIIGQGTQHQPFVSYSDFAYGISSYGNSINHFALEFSGPVHPQSTDLVSNYLGITNQWNHVVVVRNGNACDYYLNGTLHDSFVLNNNLLNTGAPLSIGARLIHNSFQGGNQITNYFKGDIDNVTIWNRVLNQSEISQLFTPAPTYLWSTGETTATINPTPTATTTYWCDVTVNGVTCRKEITITVDSAPAPTVTTPVTYCQNSVASPLTATGVNLLWYTVPTGGTGSATAPTPDTTTAGSTTWYVSQSIAGCESTREVIVINVTPSPAPPLVTTPLVYCQNSAAIPLAATGTNLLWYTAPNAGIGSTTAPTPSTSTAGSTFYYVSQTVFGCESPREIIEVSITPTPPTPSVTSPLTYCQYSNAVPLVATGTNLLWYTASIGGSGSNTAPTPVTTFPGVRNYFVSQTISGCESPRAAIEVTITAVPFPPAVTNQVNYCQNSIATPLTATGTNLLWYTTATGGTGSVTAPTPNTATAGITNYYVSQTVAGCEGSRAIIVVRIIATPLAPPVLTPVTFCQYSTVAPLNALGPNLLWYTDPNLGTGSITAPTPDTATAGITTYYVSQSISGCEGPRAAIEVIISAAPSEPIVTTPVSYCQNSVALPLTATGTNLLWYTAATGGTGVVLAPTPITTITGNTTYYVSQTVSGCESLRTAINVIINAAPLEPTGNSSQYFCANIYPTIQDLILNQNSINWYSSATSSTALTPSTPLIPNTIYYAEQFDITTGCQSLTRLAVTVFIINENAPTIVDDLTFCEADEKTIEDINTNGAIVIWYDTPTGGTPLSSNYVLVNSQVLYAATYNSTSGCESLDRQSVTITTFYCEVKVNNLLTLDGNNLNDNLNIINIESFPANEIEIYNRYGQVVWRIENYNNTTNTFKGRANVGGVYQINDNLPTGTYYYVLKYYNPHRNKYEVTKSYLYISNTN